MVYSLSSSLIQLAICMKKAFFNNSLKKLPYVAIISLLFNCYQLNAQRSPELLPENSFTSLSLSFESYFNDSIDDFEFNANFSIVQKGEVYYGISETNLYYGTVKVPKWETLLTDSMLASIQAFLAQLNKTAQKIDKAGFNNQFYTAKFNGKIWFIKPNQHIFRNPLNQTEDSSIFPHLGFYNEIFSSQIYAYIHKRAEHKLLVDSLITRKWYVNEIAIKKVKKGDAITFYATPNTDSLNVIWEVNPDFGFNHSQQNAKDSNARVVIEYHAAENLNQYMYLSIYNAFHLLERLGLENWQKDGNNSFYILELSDKRLTLQAAY
jgi:hypothetical protein